MKIKVKQNYFTEKHFYGNNFLQLPPNATITDAIDASNIPDVGFVLLNGIVASHDTVLQDGNEIEFHATILGG